MAVLGIATAAGWILYLSSPAPKGPESTASVELQSPQSNEQLSELMTQFDLLTADHESLIQENLALHTLNEDLNETKEEAAAENAQADQQVLEMVENLKEIADNQKNERLQLLAKVNDLTAQLENLSKLASQSETAVSDTTTMGEPAPEQTAQTESAENVVQASSEETSELATSLDELNSEMVASLKESVSGLQNERLQLLAKVDQLENIQEEAIKFSEQLEENDSELERALQGQQKQSEAIAQLTERLERVLEMSTDAMGNLQPVTDSGGEVSEVTDTSMEETSAEAVAENSRANQQVLFLEQTVNNLDQSVSSLQNERLQLLARVNELTVQQLENLSKLASQSETAVSETTKVGEPAPKQTAQTEAADTATQTSTEETSELVASLDGLNGEMVVSLKEFVNSLQNQLQTTQNEVDRLALQLDSSNRRARYLEIRLSYASKHLRRHRAKNRESEVNSENLVMERQVLEEKLSETSSTLNQSIAEKESEIDFLVSKFSMIRLESDVIFDSGSAKLSTQGLETLRDIAQKYQDYPDRIMSIEGHTDNKLIAGYLAQFYPTNWELSAARAAAAANFLSQQGVPEDKLRIVGFGALQPIASNDTEEGRASNRRIEIRLAPKLSEVESN